MLTIDPQRLKQVRTARGLSQAELARRAQVDKQTINRLEREKKPRRQAVLEKVAKVLNVGMGVLMGEEPLPTDPSVSGIRVAEPSQQLNVRVPQAVRNAYELAARRYGVSVQKIAQLGPLLFVILAEASLSHRCKVADECRDKAEEFRSAANQLPLGITAYVDDGEIHAEQESINRKDVFGRVLGEASNSNNPFAVYLDALAVRYARDDIMVDAVGPTLVAYEVCRSGALALAEGNETLVESLLSGRIPIHHIPRRLTAEQRLQWMRDHMASARATKAEDSEDIAEELPEELPEYLDLSNAIAIDL